MTGKIKYTALGTFYFLDDKEVSKEEFFTALPPKLANGDGPCSLSSTPAHLSDGLAVHPDQVQEAEESAKKRGVPTEFQRDGRPVMRSRAHQKAYLKAYGFHNRDGGFGD